jgi:hypothetical protein
MLPVDAESAAALLQYGALGVVVLMLLLGACFAFLLLRSFEKSVDRVTRSIDRGFFSVGAALNAAEERLHAHIEGERPSTRITQPSPKPTH